MTDGREPGAGHDRTSGGGTPTTGPMRDPAAGWRASGPVAALGLFTVVPAPFVAAIDQRLARRALLSLPWLGLALGAAAAGAGWLVAWRGGGALLAAVVALAVLAGVTGAMHLDGLADTADGLGSRKPAAEALQVMRRSDIGPMGVASLVLVLLLDAAALSSPALVHLRWAALASMPMVGRTAVVAAARRGLRGARTSGFGALFTEVVPPAAVGATCAAVLGACAALGWWADGVRGASALALAAVVSHLVDAGWRAHLTRRLGGLTGDTFGSLVEVGQAVFLLAAVLLG